MQLGLTLLDVSCVSVGKRNLLESFSRFLVKIQRIATLDVTQCNISQTRAHGADEEKLSVVALKRTVHLKLSYVCVFSCIPCPEFIAQLPLLVLLLKNKPFLFVSFLTFLMFSQALTLTRRKCKLCKFILSSKEQDFLT